MESWEKHFNESHKEKQVPLMYLANDILQNSRRKGSEFVNEFWKILPRNLKTICDSDDNHAKTVAMRLVCSQIFYFAFISVMKFYFAPKMFHFS